MIASIANQQQATHSPAAAFSQLPDEAFVRLPSVLALYGIARPTVYRWMAEGKFPAPVRFSERLVAWNVGTLRADLRARAAGGLK